MDTSQSRQQNNKYFEKIETAMVMSKTTLALHFKDIPHHQCFDEFQIFFSSSETDGKYNDIGLYYTILYL